MERTLWLYWNNGADAMPPLIRRIYEHNVRTCDRYGWRVVLITQATVGNHLFLGSGEKVPERFYHMTPYEQSDFVRYFVLRDHGGVWLDTDFIVYDNPDKLMALMDIEAQDGRFERPSTGGETSSENLRLAPGAPLTPATFLAVREHIRGCKGSAILAAKKGSDIARALVSVVERRISEKETFTEWGEIGPEMLRQIPVEFVSQFRVVNDEAAIASANFSTWLRNPGWNLDIWFKATPLKAIEAAKAIDTYQIPVVGTWTLYRNHRPGLSQDDLIRMVFDDDRSVFKALMGLRGSPSQVVYLGPPSGATIVTCLFDLGRREASNRRSIDEYFKFGEFVLGLPHNIIVFCDPELANRISGERRTRGLLERTRVVPIAFEHLGVWKYLEAIKQGRPAINRNTVKDTLNYTLVGWAKFEFIERAAAINPFAASHLAWIDFGIAHVAKLYDHAATDLFANPPEKVRMHVLRYFDGYDVRAHEYWEYRRGHLAGGFFVGSTQNMLAFSASFWSVAETALANKYSPTEDCVMPVIAGRATDRFSFSYGDYEDVLRNHVQVRGGGAQLLFQMKDAAARQAWCHSIAIGRAAVASHVRGTFKCDEGVLEDLLMEYYNAAHQGSAKGDARRAAFYYANLVGKSPSFRSAYLSRCEFVQKNFSLLGEPVLLPMK